MCALELCVVVWHEYNLLQEKKNLDLKEGWLEGLCKIGSAQTSEDREMCTGKHMLGSFGIDFVGFVLLVSGGYSI